MEHGEQFDLNIALIFFTNFNFLKFITRCIDQQGTFYGYNCECVGQWFGVNCDQCKLSIFN
jgi:hypothetical protein